MKKKIKLLTLAKEEVNPLDHFKIRINLETNMWNHSSLPKYNAFDSQFAGRFKQRREIITDRALMNRKSYAGLAQAGKTQTINYYNINGKLYFMDLPGCSYAKVSQETKAKWGEDD